MTISKVLVVVIKEISNMKIFITVFCNSQKTFTTIQYTLAKKEN